MQRRTFITAAAGLTALAALPRPAFAAQTHLEETTTMTTTRPQSGYAPVNGIELYYEVHGQGKPLVLLHGGFMAIEMFGPVLTALAAGRQVIGVDLQGHGRTLPADRPMTFTNLATDVAELIKWLGHDKADVMGYSMGGATALRAAIDHPDVVDRLVLVSTCYAFSGWHDYNAQGMKGMAADPAAAATGMQQTPLYGLYTQLMPDAEKHWAATVAQTSAMVGADYDWSASVAGLAMPTMLVFADWDAVRTSHAASFFGLLGGGKQDAGWDGAGMNKNRLAIIPGATHYNIGTDPRLATTAAGFLDA
jgi:pimeloyl-ACP methyl ester carboxylesterase